MAIIEAQIEAFPCIMTTSLTMLIIFSEATVQGKSWGQDDYMMNTLANNMIPFHYLPFG